MPSRVSASRPLILAGALAALALACRPAPKPPIVVISIDTLRADHLPAYGYQGVQTPAIDALAKDSVIFENAYAQYPLTLPSHVAMLTGLLPPHSGVRDNVGYDLDGGKHPTLPARLASLGYATGGFVSSFVLRRETGVATGFATFDEPPKPPPGAPLDTAQRPATATLRPALAWLEGRGEEPFFLFFHVYEPHAPYMPPEPFASRYPNAYDGEIAAADAAVGQLLDELRRRGIYDRAWIVLMSDHGEGLGEHDELQHGVFLYRSTLRVALMVKQPKARDAGRRVTELAGLIDVAPTLIEAAGAPEPRELDGRDLRAALRGEALPPRGLYAETYYPRLHFGWSDLQAWVEPRWYLVRGPQPELFDLAADAAQTRNVLLDNRRDYARLEAEIERLNAPLAEPQGVDEDTARRLASLGYLSAGGGAAKQNLPDPKTQRHLLRGIEAGLDAFWAGRDAEAIAAFRGALAENPEMSDIWAYLARSLDRTGDRAAGLAAWERVLTLSGGMGSVALIVAERYLELGDYARARQIAESVRESAPRGALDLLIEVDLAQGHTKEAEARMNEAVARGVASETVKRRLALEALRAGRAADALATLGSAAEREEPATLIVRGLLLGDLGRQQEGLDALESARKASHAPGEFYEHLGIALLGLDRLDQARAAFEEAVKADPRLASAWNSLGVVQARMGNAPKAVAAWRQAVSIDASLIDAWFNLGLTAAQAGDRGLAREALGQYLRRAPAQAAADRARAQQALAAMGGA
jgi:choline-sulfatase